MIKKIKKLKSGFVILFAVTLSAILLSIAVGVTNIAFKELKFGTNARDANDAFFAADTGMEKILFQDKTPNTYLTGNIYELIYVTGLGSVGKSCAIVTVDKQTDSTFVIITSKGYNIGSGVTCSPPNNAVERQLEVRYLK